ncbi:hypothetical protein Plhal304r1_c006g0024391 [Plasmopara halstedii]
MDSIDFPLTSKGDKFYSFSLDQLCDALMKDAKINFGGVAHIWIVCRDGNIRRYCVPCETNHFIHCVNGGKM